MGSIVNVVLKNKKEQYKKRIHNIFTIKFANFYQFSFRFTTNITFLLITIILSHQ